MSRTMLNDQHWLKLKSIVHNLRSTSNIIFEILLNPFSIELEQVVLGETYLNLLVSPTPYLNDSPDGLKIISY